MVLFKFTCQYQSEEDEDGGVMNGCGQIGECVDTLAKADAIEQKHYADLPGHMGRVDSC